MQTRNPTTNEAFTAINSIVSDLSIRTHKMKEVAQAQVSKIDQIAQTQEAKFEQMMSMLQKMNGLILDLHHRHPENEVIDSQTPSSKFSQVQSSAVGFDVMVESVESAEVTHVFEDVESGTTAENIVVLEVDVVAESGKEDFGLEVDLHSDSTKSAVIGCADMEVTSDKFTIDDSSAFLWSKDDLGKCEEHDDLNEEIRLEASLDDLISNFSFRVSGVCRNASMNQPTHFTMHMDLSSRLNNILPPAKPPDDDVLHDVVTWNIRRDRSLQQFGFKRCTQEQAVYAKKGKEGDIIIGVYVDDLIVTGESLLMVEKFKEQLTKEFEMNDLGNFSKPHNGDVKIYCPAIDKPHVPVDILSKVLRKQNNNKTILVVDLGGNTSDACDFEFILMLKVAGYWSLALSSIQKDLALLIDNSSQVLPTEFYGKCTLDMPPYAVIDEVITLEEHFYRPRTYDIGDRVFLELLLPNEQIVLKRVRVFIFYTEPLKLTYDIIISATATEGTSSANSSVTIDPTYKFLNDDVTMVVVAVHTCFNIFQREASKGARRMAGLEVSRGIGEHTVIFMEYEFEKKNSGQILVFDPGGGTFNVSNHKEFANWYVVEGTSLMNPAITDLLVNLIAVAVAVGVSKTIYNVLLQWNKLNVRVFFNFWVLTKFMAYDHMYLGSSPTPVHGNIGASRTLVSWEMRFGIVLGATSGIAFPHMRGSGVYYGHTKAANKSYEFRGHDFSLFQLAFSSYAKHLITLAPAATSHWICPLTRLHVATGDNASAQQFVYNWLRMLDAHISAYGWTANREKFQEQFIVFSSPRPPEVADLEDKVNFMGRGMLRTQYYLNKGV